MRNNDRTQPTSFTPAPNQLSRPRDFVPFRFRQTIEELGEAYSADMMSRAAADVAEMREANARGPWRPDWQSLDTHVVPAWFEDAKLGIFLDWGPWSVAGWAPAEGTGMTGGTYPDWYEFLMANHYREYHDTAWGSDFRRDDLLSLLSGAEFDADAYAELAVEAGAKYFVPFSRHHGGWTMWHSRFTFRNAVEMGPGRDVYRELADACRARDLKFGLYFSISEWEYPALLGAWRNELTFTNWQPQPSSFYSAEMNALASGKIPVRDYFTDYLMPLFKEALDGFSPDLAWFDGGWNTTAELNHTTELSAYFYNAAEGLREVAINDRACLSRTAHGDYRTREYNSGQDVQGSTKWEICRSISPAFGYNWQDNDENCLSSHDLIRMLVRVVSENGNLLLVIGPDGAGRLPEIQVKRLRDLGAWLHKNGEGIYGTRPWERPHDGDTYFTSSRDGTFVYMHCMGEPAPVIRVRSLAPLPGSEIRGLARKPRSPGVSTGSGSRSRSRPACPPAARRLMSSALFCACGCSERRSHGAGRSGRRSRRGLCDASPNAPYSPAQ